MMKMLQQGDQANFGRRQSGTQPTVAHVQRRSRLRYFVMLISLPIVAFLAVKFVTGKATFSYHVTFSGNESNLSQLLDQCGGKNGTTPDLQIAACSTLIESGRGNDRGLSVAFYDRGNAYQQKGDFDHAIADYDQAIRHSPGMSGAFGNRGTAYQAKGQYALAVADYNEAIRINPKYAMALQNRCWVRFVMGQLSDALADCDESLRLRPNSALAFNARGFVHLKMGALDMASVDFVAALASDPMLASALYGRGLAKQKQGAPGDVDIAAAKAKSPGIAKQYAHYGIE